MEGEKISPEQKEYRLQLAVVKHLDTYYKGRCEYLHIPNRGGSAADGFFKKQMGAKAGASDIMMTWQQNSLHCAMIELKAPEGTVSTPQNKFLSRYSFLGWHTAVCKTVQEVDAALAKWGLLSGCKQPLEPDYRSDAEKRQDAFAFFCAPPRLK